ncbi:hypothetical protein BDR04DRAFT_1121077 [Suillus decipiens]|nr:hypothetical protein BDR04DRAFT_1121077 [Suillus decipiens]
MADHDTIKLELPAQLKTFKFTFECRRPGPLTVEISMQRSLKRSKSQPSTSESLDTSETQTERPEILTHWLQAQETHQVFLAKIQDLTQQPNKSNAGQPVDDSETEPESDIEHLPESPATPAEFTRWYNKVHLQAGSTKQMVDSETEPELEISKQERKSPIDFIYEAMINANFTRVGQRVILGAHTDAGPVPRGFTVPLHEPTPPLSLDFHDPLEDAILDYGVLTEADLGIATPSSPLPNLGPNMRSPEALIAAIDHFDAHNNATAAGSRPLTPHDAHQLPVDPEQHAFERQLARTFEEMQDEDVQHVDQVDEGLDDDVDIDVDANFDDQDQDSFESLNTGPNEDDPDPFLSEEILDLHNNMDFADVPPHLLTIYALVSWLHLQFHLPRVVCNALLAVFACLLISLSPAIDALFITLQSSNRVLRVDKSTYVLPVCPVCRDVYPPAGSLHSHEKCTTCGVDLFLPDQTKRGNLRAIRSPVIKYPYLPLSEQLKSLLKIPGLEATLDAWRLKPRNPRQYTDIFDGDMCSKKLQGADGKLFFSNLPHEKHGPDGEVLIYSKQHSNIPLLLSNILFNMQPSSRISAGSSMLSWWLLFVTNQQHIKLEGWHRILTHIFHLNHEQTWSNETQAFVKEHATQYTQLSRLPYFDLVEQIVVDPMHNLFLGLVKTHFYNIWVQSKILRANHELDTFHDMLADFIVPGSSGKLPTDIGMPSGGSLTADQWILLATVYDPIVIPQLWSACLPTDADNDILCQQIQKETAANHKAQQKKALEEAKKMSKGAFEAEKARISQEKLASAEAKTQEKLRAVTAKQAEKVRLAAEKKAKAAERKLTDNCISPRHQRNAKPWLKLLTTFQKARQEPAEANMGSEEGADDLKYLLHPDDPANFLKLCIALRILIKCSLSDEDIDCADGLIREYNTELIHLYGSAVLKPNHHFSTHVSACARNFGPLHDFWTFLFERLNKTYNLLCYPKESLPCEAAEIMLKASNEERGTVAGLAALSKDLEDAQVDAHDTRPRLFGEYCDRDTQLPLLIDPDWIVGQLGMTTVSLGDSRTKVWASIEIVKVFESSSTMHYMISRLHLMQ